MSSRASQSERFQSFTRRAALLGGGQLALFGALGARMYWLQVIEADQYQVLAEENRINQRLLPPIRGRILDRFGRELASNRQNFRVVLIPEQTQSVEDTLDRLGQIVEISAFTRERVMRDVERNRAFALIPVVENLTWAEFAQINVNAPALPGVQPEVGSTRIYPHGPTVAHIIGYVGSPSEKDLDGDPVLQLPDFKIGKVGVEKTLEGALRGAAGDSRVEVNAHGRVIRELQRREGRAGGDVRLTVDLEMQRYAMRRLSGESAAAVAMDVRNGDVVLAASSPGFDPTPFVLGLSHGEWNALISDPMRPLHNKTIAGQYPPGSTFKMVVALAALDAGVVSPGHRVTCRGHYELGKDKFHCWKRRGHGTMNLKRAIKHSCDVYFYDLAKRTGIDRIRAMALKLGLGQDLGVELVGEKAGLIPSREWKLARYGKPWLIGETLISGIGQSFVLATPLQLAVMTARIGNGGLAVKPRLVRAIGDEAASPAPLESLGVEPRWLSLVQNGMNAVVNEKGGTASRAKLGLKGVAMAGKTGTSQVRRITKAERKAGVKKNEDLPWKYRDHALFVAYAPVERPRYAISVIVEHGGSGSKTAAPIARDVMTELLKRDPASGVAAAALQDQG